MHTIMIMIWTLCWFWYSSLIVWLSVHQPCVGSMANSFSHIIISLDVWYCHTEHILVTPILTSETKKKDKLKKKENKTITSNNIWSYWLLYCSCNVGICVSWHKVQFSIQKHHILKIYIKRRCWRTWTIVCFITWNIVFAFNLYSVLWAYYTMKCLYQYSLI